ncbi:Alpha/Beta hydrolase protein [Hysterangium stoloniferum]|nr:Alpha/Beta hydrolase protein [Hysterangium stoloniferum]
MARQISKLYRELAELPVYTSAYFLGSSSSISNIRVTTSVRDHLRKVKRIVNKYIVSTETDVIVTPSHEDPEALATVPSPSGTRLGVLREISDGSSKKRFVEVWQGNRLEAAKEVTKTHEEFHINPKTPDVPDTAEDDSKKFRYLPDFGERLSGKKCPALYMFRWRPENYEEETDITLSEQAQDPSIVALKPALPEESTFVFGQASFSPDDKHIFATGYEETPDGRRLGPVGCWNHPSAIFKLDLPDVIPDAAESVELEAERLTPPTLACRSPRVTPAFRRGGYTTVWLANPIGGAHASATSLYALGSDESVPKVLVDSVSEASKDDSFPGLYTDQLPARPFLSLGVFGETSHVVAPSIWGSSAVILRISLQSGAVVNLTPSSKHAWNVLGTDGKNGILGVRSSLKSPPELAVAYVPESWRVIDKPELTDSTREKLNGIESTLLDIPDHFPTQVITVQVAGKGGLPTISIPHGGPHGTFIPEFNPSALAMALEGYLINLINYTGSLGFGQKYVDALIGRAGELDVNDCYGSIQHLIELGLSQEGPGKQFVQGGSHGGFLSAHLIGQHPDFFSASVMRNPVIAVGEIASVSDIPDWAFLEFGTAFGPTTTTTEIFDALQKASPIAHIDSTQAPVLLLVGDGDRRVPNSQARNYFHALKGRGREVEMLVFPGNGHSLDTVEAELVGWESARNWFERFVER